MILCTDWRHRKANEVIGTASSPHVQLESTYYMIYQLRWVFIALYKYCILIMVLHKPLVQPYKLFFTKKEISRKCSYFKSLCFIYRYPWITTMRIILQVQVISVMNSIRKRVRESTESVQAIYEDLLCSARSTEWDDTTEVVKNIPTFYSSRSSLYR